MLFLVVLVGWLNVGKLIIFNVLICMCDVLVYDQFGVICDCNYGVCCFDEDNYFLVVDIGGIVGEDEGLVGVIICQVCVVVVEVDLILFVVDVCEGILVLDDEILVWLCKLL